MAKTDSPAPDDNIAVFDIKELPGNESRIDLAFLVGSSAGTFEACRVEVRVAGKSAGTRRGMVGRSRTVPEKYQYERYCTDSRNNLMKLTSCNPC